MRLNYIDNIDCLEGMKALPDKSVDLIVTDPPYGSTQNKWDTVVSFGPLWEQLLRVLRDDGAVLMFSQMPFSAKAVESCADLFRYEWVWLKNKATGFLNAKKMPMKSHENILVFYKRLPVYHAQGLVEKPRPTINKGARGKKAEGAGGSNYGRATRDAVQTHEGYPKDVIYFPVEAKPLHPTQKPVPLLEYLIKTYSNPGDTVLDPFMGSGTTAVACIRTGRNYIGYELDPQYHAIAVQRAAEAREAVTT